MTLAVLDHKGESLMASNQQRTSLPDLSKILSQPQVRYDGQAIIRPEFAKWLLVNKNPSNRRIRKTNVDYFLALIVTGQWDADFPDPMAFYSPDGTVANCQHRVKAISQHTCPIIAHVRTAVSQTVRTFLDRIVPRSLSDVMYFSGRSIDRYVCDMLNARLVMDGLRRKATPDEVMALFESNRSGFLFAAEWRQIKRKAITIAPVALALAEMHQKSAISAEPFARALHETTSDAQQADFLKAVLLRKMNENGYSASVDKYRLAVAAAKAYMVGRRIGRLVGSEW